MASGVVLLVAPPEPELATTKDIKPATQFLAGGQSFK
jgi:hypothetical protein